MKRHKPPTKHVPVFLPWIVHNNRQPTPELMKKMPWKAQPCPALRQCQAEDIHDKQKKYSCPHHLLQRVCYPDGREAMRFTRLAYFPCCDALMIPHVIEIGRRLQEVWGGMRWVMNVNRRCLTMPCFDTSRSCTWDYEEEERCFQISRSWSTISTDLKVALCEHWLTVCCTISRCIQRLLLSRSIVKNRDISHDMESYDYDNGSPERHISS